MTLFYISDHEINHNVNMMHSYGGFKILSIYARLQLLLDVSMNYLHIHVSIYIIIFENKDLLKCGVTFCFGLILSIGICSKMHYNIIVVMYMQW